MTKASLVRDEGVAGSNPATPTSFPVKSDGSPDSFPDRITPHGSGVSDIVERLRWSGQDAMTKHLSLGMHKLHTEAADLIERLRHRNAALAEIVRDSLCPYNGRATGVTVGECQQCGCSHGLLIGLGRMPGTPSRSGSAT